MATEKIYLKKMYARYCEATVLEAVENKVVLDRTVFYAESGGQVGDTGTINQLKIIDTQKRISSQTKMLTHPDFPSINVNTDVVHYLEKADHTLQPGATVNLTIDWDRRYSIMRLHSGAHVVWHFVEQELGNLPIKGCLIGPDKARLDFGAKIDPGAIPALNERCNGFIRENHNIENLALDQEPEALFWICHDIKIPCGGTHVRNTSEIGPVELKRRSQGKKLDRLYITFSTRSEQS